MAQTRHPPKTVLIFDARKKLILVAASVLAASKFSGMLACNISRACSGTNISSGKFYFRYVSDKVELETTDLGTLDLESYDKMCNVTRPVYANTKMNRENWKYQKSKKSKKDESKNSQQVKQPMS